MFQVQDIVRPVIQNNAYYALPENMLASMLEDGRDSVRKRAVEKILQMRLNPPKPPRSKVSGGIRFNKVPTLIWEAKDWTEIADLDNLKYSEPPVTRKYSDNELRLAIDCPMNFEKFPVHSQSVERCVKLVTEAASSVYGHEKRHGFILAKVTSRKCRPSFSSKKHYKIKDL